ncbi:MAG: hypothetical protein E6K82_04510 [Candidatus Rokuibacteriota bacterium]|nr:MAG: hypothetical protein E6K82_04510 [Candidatus Rokubacteria bacterium]
MDVDPVAARRALDAALAEPARLDPAPLSALGATAPDALDDTVRAFADAHGAAALPVLEALTSDRVDRAVRRVARRALYRLAQRGVQPAPRPAPRPVVERRAERALRAWLSGIDGSGSRAVWVLFEGALSGYALCSLIVNDQVGVVDVAGGEISKKRLEAELAALRASQKLPWVEVEPARALQAVGEALTVHRARGTAPPAAFQRWERLFAPAEGPPLPAPPADAALVERGATLLELPELAGWFLDPESVQSDALEMLQARDSKLVVSDQIKAERDEALVGRVVEREFDADARRRWARRLVDMAFVFRATDRPEPAALAEAAAAALVDDAREPRRQPFARALAQRALEVAAEVALGRIPAAEVSRKPGAA